MKKKSSDKEDLLHRLRIAEGHLKKVIAMIEENAYCIDVLMQSSAVRSALKKVQDLLLERHLRTCVSSSLKNEKDHHVINELIDIYTRGK